MFWTAKSAEKLGRIKFAQQLYKDVNIRFPYTYYGIRSGKKRINKKPTPNKNNDREISLEEPNLSTQEQFHYLRGVELSAIGFYEDASYEIEKIEDTAGGCLWAFDDKSFLKPENAIL